MGILFFWLIAGVALWCLIGYPTVILARSRLGRQGAGAVAPPAPAPVSVILAVRNEEANLAPRLANLLALDYPPELLEVVVVCNGCTDGTEAEARRLGRGDPRIRVQVSPPEHGKAGALNLGAECARGDYLIFADARQRFERSAVRRLLGPFGDPCVGAVTGRLLLSRTDRPAVEGLGRYWRLETALRLAESRTGSVVGVTGAIYAMRCDLFVPLPPKLILDDVYLPMQIAMRGYRISMAPEALAFDTPSCSLKLEYARRRRTMLGNIQLIRIMPSLLVPGRNPLFLRFLSHKLLRLILPFCFLGMVALAAVLPGPFYRSVFVLGLAVYALGLVGLAVALPALSIPASFVLMHGAIFSALRRYRQDAADVWPIPGPVQAVSAPARSPVP